MNEQVDILNFEFSTKGIRDIGIVEPILSYLELKYNLKVVRENISNNFCKIINKHKPKLILVSNGIGTSNHFEMVKYATLKGIKVVTCIAEGDMVDNKENVEILLWGNNKDKIFYEYANLQWSLKNINLIHKHIPESVNFNLICTGATGFDRYKFLPLKSKEEFYTQYPQYINYKKIIGLAGFPFYFFLSDIYKKNGQWSNMHLDHASCDIMATQKEPLRKLYKELIEKNPDILFILKYHPADFLKEYSEFYELNQFKNTLSIYKEENIDDIINISDLWIAFESTTCLEAWLLNKTTLIANPNNIEFIRSINAIGSPHFGDFLALNNEIKFFFENGYSQKFINLEEKREEAIAQIIGFGDGLNHKRAGEYVYSIINIEYLPRYNNNIEFFKRIERKYNKIEIKKKIRHLLYKTPLIFIPRIKNEFIKDKLKEEEFSYIKRIELRNLYYNALIRFYNN